ncbi:MAG: hypothetical protein EPO62_07685 [Candidatus Nitrosotenuis sp.]|nr:MAG: hypothetical protein EPO62_07685 [Candidatus Nitrosotenuis sp.]
MSKKKNPESAAMLSMIAMDVNDQNNPTLPLKNNIIPKTAGNKTMTSNTGYIAAHIISERLAFGLKEYTVYIVGTRNAVTTRDAHTSIFLEMDDRSGLR